MRAMKRAPRFGPLQRNYFRRTRRWRPHMAQDQSQKAKPQDQVVKDVVFVVVNERLKPHTFPAQETLGKASQQALKKTHSSEDLSGYELLDSSGKKLNFEDTFAKAQIKDEAVLKLQRPRGVSA